MMRCSVGEGGERTTPIQTRYSVKKKEGQSYHSSHHSHGVKFANSKETETMIPLNWED